MNDNIHKCSPPKKPPPNKIWICENCKLTWEYGHSFNFVPGNLEKISWHVETPMEKKTRESHERLEKQRKRNKT